MDAAAIRHRLTKTISEYVDRHGVRLGDGADADFNGMVAKAADEIAGMSAALQQTKISEAERAFETLIDEMIAEGSRIPGYQAGIIGEKTLEAAKRKLCPLWPIC